MQKHLLTLALAVGTVVGTVPMSSVALADANVHQASVPKAVTTSQTAAPAPKHYNVADGDSLSSIAQAQGADSWRDLWNANAGLTDPNLIYPGQDLVIPSSPTTDRPLPAGFDAATMPVVTPTAAPSRSTTPDYAAGVGGLLQSVRMHESGGNYATNTGNGFYGAYQFTLGTWASVGGTGLPSNASPAEQDMRAQLLYAQRGCSPWPNTCY